MNITDVIIRPIITEQSMEEVGKGKCTFQVARFADKKIIANAVEKLFNVEVVSVRTKVVKGKSRRFGKKMKEVKQSPWKKAVVELKKGQKIDVFEIGSKS